MFARRGVAAVHRGNLLPGQDRRFKIAQLRLTETGDLEQLLFPGLGRGAGRTRGLHQHVTELGILPFLPKVIFDPRERLGCAGFLEREDLAVFRERLRLLVLGDQRRGIFQLPDDLVVAER